MIKRENWIWKKPGLEARSSVSIFHIHFRIYCLYVKSILQNKQISMNYFSDQVFENTDYTIKPLPIAEYEACRFTTCNFSATLLNNFSFIDCVFENCNLSNVSLSETIIRDIEFNSCKMLGLHFDSCNSFLFSATFNSCTLNFSSFYKLKLKNFIFKNCTLHEVDFADADLCGASFTNCDLKDATFDNTVLEKADLSTSFNYTIDPEKNKIKKAKFSADGLHGLLTKYGIVVK